MAKKIFAGYRKIFNFIQLFRKSVSYGKKLTITGLIGIHGTGNITIGNDVLIHSSQSYNPVAGGIRTHLRTEGRGVF